MGVFGTIMKFIMIVLVVALTIFVVIGAILMIFPAASIFGLHYISSPYNGEQTQHLRTAENSTMWEGADFYRIETRGYDVVVRVKETGQQGETYPSGTYEAVVESSYKGFVWGGNAPKPTYSSSITDEKYIEENGSKIFYIKMAEPDGMLVRSKTQLTLIVETSTFQNKKLEIITKSGSVSVGGNIEDNQKLIKTKNLTINSESGKVMLNNVTIDENLVISKNAGDVISEKDIDAAADISIVGGYGIIDLQNVGTQQTTRKLKINTSNTHTTVKNVYGDLEFKADGGMLEATQITQDVDLTLGACDCQIGKIGNTLNVDGGDGYVKIDEVVGKITQTMKNGETTIQKNMGEVDFSSEKGSLYLKKANDNVTATTSYGNIEITCNNTLNLNVSNKHGSTKFYNASGVVTINGSGNGTGSVVGEFDQINGASSIVGFAGNIELKVPTQRFLLNWRNISGKVDIKYGSFITTDKTTSEYLSKQEEQVVEEKVLWVDVQTTKQAMQDSNTNRLSVTNNSGDIKIYSL